MNESAFWKLEWETPAFISPDMWIPTVQSEPGCIAYSIWGETQQRFYHMKGHNADLLYFTR